MEINYIYCLVDPDTLEKRYVGKTKNIKERHRKHLLPSYLKPDTYKNRWLRKLKANGKKPHITVLSEVDSRVDDINEVEKMWIRVFKAAGHPLTNTTLGGDGGNYWKGQLKFKFKKPRPYSWYHATQKNIKQWKITDPLGQTKTIRNLSEFCKQNHLNSSKMSAVALGKDGRTHHKGWNCEKLSD